MMEHNGLAKSFILLTICLLCLANVLIVAIHPLKHQIYISAFLLGISLGGFVWQYAPRFRNRAKGDERWK